METASILQFSRKTASQKGQALFNEASLDQAHQGPSILLKELSERAKIV